MVIESSMHLVYYGIRSRRSKLAGKTVKSLCGFLPPTFHCRLLPFEQRGSDLAGQDLWFARSSVWELKGEDKGIRPRVPTITKVWKKTRGKPDLLASTDKVCSHSEQGFQIGKKKSLDAVSCPTLAESSIANYLHYPRWFLYLSLPHYFHLSECGNYVVTASCKVLLQS